MLIIIKVGSFVVPVHPVPRKPRAEAKLSLALPTEEWRLIPKGLLRGLGRLASRSGKAVVTGFTIIRSEFMKKGDKRVTADCRKFPSKNKCTLTISGRMHEVLPVALQHAVKSHGHKNTPAFRRELAKFIK